MKLPYFSYCRGFFYDKKCNEVALPECSEMISASVTVPGCFILGGESPTVFCYPGSFVIVAESLKRTCLSGCQDGRKTSDNLCAYETGVSVSFCPSGGTPMYFTVDKCYEFCQIDTVQPPADGCITSNDKVCNE